MNLRQHTPRRVLVIRLDRIGDVVLSTPVVQALREAYPHAFIAMLVSPACQELVAGNPHLNEVMTYDKRLLHRSVLSTVRFARRLRSMGFDTALVLHPSNRSHWIPWLAQIPVRVGYARKSRWLLTHRLPHRKQEGERHEAEYTLDLLTLLGRELPLTPRPLVVVQPRCTQRVEGLLSSAMLEAGRPLVAIHPSASCVSKRWLPDRFAQVADRLITDTHVSVCLVAGDADMACANQVAGLMRHPAVNLAGRLTLGELAALLARSRLLISNDSGPVHIAAAVGTPVVDIFGRNQRGLSRLRWGPIGDGHMVLQKDVGCVTCLAHACDIDFLCLTSLTVEEVYQAAASILARKPGVVLAS